MFARTSKTLIAAAMTALATASLAGTASAQEDNLSVELTGLQASEGQLFVSVQSEGEYKKQRGSAGGVFKVEAAGDQTFTFAVAAGTYAVSIWHDIDNDGQFSMDENWIPTDGWGMSGTPRSDKEPTFDETKITVAASGTSVRIPMVYRN